MLLLQETDVKRLTLYPESHIASRWQAGSLNLPPVNFEYKDYPENPVGK